MYRSKSAVVFTRLYTTTEGDRQVCRRLLLLEAAQRNEVEPADSQPVETKKTKKRGIGVSRQMLHAYLRHGASSNDLNASCINI
jgi:transposase